MKLLGLKLLLLAGVRGTLVCERVPSARAHLLSLGVSDAHSAGRFPDSQLSPKLLKHDQWIFKPGGERFYLTEQRLSDPLSQADFDWKRATLPRLQTAGLLPARLRCFQTDEFGYFLLETHKQELCTTDARVLLPLGRAEQFIREMIDSFRRYDALGVAVAQAHHASLYCFGAQFTRPAFAAFADFIPAEGRGYVAQTAYALWKPVAADQLESLEGVVPKVVMVQATRTDTLFSFVKTLAREMSWWRREPSAKYQPLFEHLAPQLKRLEGQLLGPEAQDVTWKKLRRAIKAAGLYFRREKPEEPAQSPRLEHSSSSSSSSGRGSFSSLSSTKRGRPSFSRHRSFDTFLEKA